MSRCQSWQTQLNKNWDFYKPTEVKNHSPATLETFFPSRRIHFYQRTIAITDWWWVHKQVCSTYFSWNSLHWIPTNQWLYKRPPLTVEIKSTTIQKAVHPIKAKEIIQGFKVWPEQTSTSPSGHHLGIYKSLAKDFPPPKDKATCNLHQSPHTQFKVAMSS